MEKNKKICKKNLAMRVLPSNFSVGKRRLLIWGFILTFFLSCLGSMVFMPQKAEAKTVVDTRSGRSHTVMLYDDGTVEATGSNGRGQCEVNGASNVVAIGAGDDFSMVLYDIGVVGGYGYIYFGTPAGGSQWYLPRSNFNICAISASSNGYAILKTDGTVECYGQIPDGEYYRYYRMERYLQSTGHNDVVAIYHCCRSVSYWSSSGGCHLLKSDGSVETLGTHHANCTAPPVGSNLWGRCIEIKSSGPEEPSGDSVTRKLALKYRQKIAIGGYPLAVLSNGTLVSWNWDGTWRTVPEQAKNNVATILGSQVESAVIKKDGSLVYLNDDPNRPDIVKSDVADIDSVNLNYDYGATRSVVLKSDGSVVVWVKENRRTGTSLYAPIVPSVDIYNYEDMKAIAVPYSHYKAPVFWAGLQKDEELVIGMKQYDWSNHLGGNPYSSTSTNQGDILDITAGQVFYGTICPPEPPAPTTFTTFAGLKDNGGVTVWATRIYKHTNFSPYAFVDQPVFSVPQEVQGGVQQGIVVDIAGNPAFFSALKYDGSVVCWKYNQEGDNFTPVLTPVPQVVKSDVLAIQANCSSEYALALRADGSVVAWDVNGNLLPVPGINLFDPAPKANTDISGQWGLDSAKDGIAIDSSGNSNNGVIAGASLTTGIISNALQFDGIDDNVTFSYSKPENNFTLEAWVKATETHQIDIQSNSGTAGTAGQKYIFGANQEGANGGIGVSVGTNGVSVYEHGDGYMPALAVYNGAIGTDWVHVVVVVENQTPKIYVNGVLKHTGLKSTRPKSLAPTTLGYGSYGAFKGRIDEAALYNKVLTAAEIEQKYKKIVFLDKITLTNQYNDEATARCTFGTHLNKLEFELHKPVNELTLALDFPSNMGIGCVEEIIFNNTDSVSVPVSAATVLEGHTIKLTHPLNAGKYTLKLLLTINQELIVQTKAYSDDQGTLINNDSGRFEFEFMDFKDLPDVT
jgi:alpha-tubulin suppressor-like RCC1 family protein